MHSLDFADFSGRAKPLGAEKGGHHEGETNEIVHPTEPNGKVVAKRRRVRPSEHRYPGRDGQAPDRVGHR